MIQHLPEARDARHFKWPEPLVIDLIHERYSHTVAARDSIMLAKLQERTLRALFDGATLRSSALRLELVVCCAARGVDHEAIARIDRAVFSELTRLVETCFRTSPRVRAAIAEELCVALKSIAVDASSPVKASVVGRRAAAPRQVH